MKCAMEMLMVTAEERAKAQAERLERERIEAERKERERIEREIQEKIYCEKACKAMVEKILTNFENAFRKWEEDPSEFVYEYVSYDFGHIYRGGQKFFELYEDGTVYADGTHSSSCHYGKMISTELITTLLNQLCYSVEVDTRISDDYRHYGSGYIELPCFKVRISPDCLA